MFGDQLARVWDLIYQTGRGKDYHAEAELVAETVRARNPGARSLLDVGCGTGEHMVAFGELFDHAEGVDLSEPMISIARDKAPHTTFHVGDMCTFDLGRSFDAVVSLYTAVGYLPSLDALSAALRRMAAHLTPDGVLVVEPWWFAEKFLDGHVAGDVVQEDGRTVARVSRTERRDDRAHMEIHYTVADGNGIQSFTESHSFGIWTRQQYLQAFADAGCQVEYVEDVLYCGMFVGCRA
ncbi:methyltransferase domain-containing protein [Actinomadura sp. 1N219]|uniref:methyltransferase domain-containing protein n=1 Tax=Actinomadura sp. 1N219 TaxID=3375152 RepID=UPI00378C4F44